MVGPAARQQLSQRRVVEGLAERHGEQHRDADGVGGQLPGEPVPVGLPAAVGDAHRARLARAGRPRGDQALLLESHELAVDLAAGQAPELPDPQLRDPHQLTAGELAAAAVEQREQGGLGGVHSTDT